MPHHTVYSWSSYWTRDPLASRLLAAARESWTGGQGSTTDGENEVIEVEDDQETVEEEGSIHESDKDEAATSEYGYYFGAAEVKAMAKYIARYNPDDWAMMTAKQKWSPYHLEVTLPGDHVKTFADSKLSVQHPHRSEVAYNQKYRVKERGMFSVRCSWYKVDTFS